jgi:hypothetical protein
MIKLATFGILAFALSLFAVDMAQGQTMTPTATPTPTTSVTTTATPTPTGTVQGDTTVPSGAPATGYGTGN